MKLSVIIAFYKNLPFLDLVLSGLKNQTYDDFEVIVAEDDDAAAIFGAFDSFVVVDLHAQYRVSDRLVLDAGIDNVNGEKYFLYHPFPQWTFTGEVRVLF